MKDLMKNTKMEMVLITNFDKTDLMINLNCIDYQEKNEKDYIQII